MSEHGHDEHEAHDSHGGSTHAKSHADEGHGHDDHGGHGHDEHDDHGHGERWGDYNSQPPAPSTLPAVPTFGLAIMGGVLAFLLGMIVYASMVLGCAEGAAASHGGHVEGHAESHDAQGVHAEKKEEH